jgi:cell cycle arrest protein BUB3
VSILTTRPALYDLEPSPEDAISSLKFSASSSKLLVSCWDKHVYLYDAQGEEHNQLIRKFEHRAPVLDVCFGDSDDTAYSGGLDNDVRRYVQSGSSD